MDNIYFISGIDTDAGKSYCTAWLAQQLIKEGKRVITQKFIQTGNVGHSEDIDLHRRLMGTGLLLVEIIEDENTATQIRLNAIDMLLRHTYKQTEMVDILERLSVLERMKE